MKHVDRVEYYTQTNDDPVIQRETSIVPRVGERVEYTDLLAEDGAMVGTVKCVGYELAETSGNSFTVARVHLDVGDTDE